MSPLRSLPPHRLPRRHVAPALGLALVALSCASIKQAPVTLAETAAKVIAAPVRVAIGVVREPVERAADLAMPVVLGGLH